MPTSADVVGRVGLLCSGMLRIKGAREEYREARDTSRPVLAFIHETDQPTSQNEVHHDPDTVLSHFYSSTTPSISGNTLILEQQNL